MGAPKGTNSMAIAGLSFRNTLVSCMSLLSSMHKWAKKQSSQIVSLPFPAVKPVPSMDKWLPAESYDYCKLNGVRGLGREHVEDGYKGIRVKFGAKNPTELRI